MTEVNLSSPLSKDWEAAKRGQGKEINTPPPAFCLSLPCGTREAPLRMPRAGGKSGRGNASRKCEASGESDGAEESAHGTAVPTRMRTDGEGL